MKPDLKKNLIILAVAGVALFALFNLTHEYYEAAEIMPVSGLLVIPFALLLASIAIVPFINRHWWEHNYPKVAFGLGALMVLYYIFVLGNMPRLLLTFYEYVSFITLIGALFIVSGGIHLKIPGKSAPYENVILLAVGAIISNLLGTTGASMLEDQQVSHQTVSRCLLHLHRKQCRRSLDPYWRSSAVPGILKGCSVLLGYHEGMAHLGSGHCHAACRVLCY